jgi:hypothetical protein
MIPRLPRASRWLVEAVRYAECWETTIRGRRRGVQAVIPAGRTGWMKLQTVENQAITGAVILAGTDGFRGGHNLHFLTTTAVASLTIPVVPANR